MVKYRNVGRSGLKVNPIAFGSWMTDLRGPVSASMITGAAKPARLENSVQAGDLEPPADGIAGIEGILDDKPFCRKMG